MVSGIDSEENQQIAPRKPISTGKGSVQRASKESHESQSSGSTRRWLHDILSTASKMLSSFALELSTILLPAIAARMEGIVGRPIVVWSAGAGIGIYASWSRFNDARRNPAPYLLRSGGEMNYINYLKFVYKLTWIGLIGYCTLYITLGNLSGNATSFAYYVLQASLRHKADPGDGDIRFKLLAVLGILVCIFTGTALTKLSRALIDFTIILKVLNLLMTSVAGRFHPPDELGLGMGLPGSTAFLTRENRFANATTLIFSSFDHHNLSSQAVGGITDWIVCFAYMVTALRSTSIAVKETPPVRLYSRDLLVPLAFLAGIFYTLGKITIQANVVNEEFDLVPSSLSSRRLGRYWPELGDTALDRVIASRNAFSTLGEITNQANVVNEEFDLVPSSLSSRRLGRYYPELGDTALDRVIASLNAFSTLGSITTAIAVGMSAQQEITKDRLDGSPVTIDGYFRFLYPSVWLLLSFNTTETNKLFALAQLQGTIFLAGILTSAGVLALAGGLFMYLKQDFLDVRYTGSGFETLPSTIPQARAWFNMERLNSDLAIPASKGIHALWTTASTAFSSLLQKIVGHCSHLIDRWLRPRLKTGFRRLEWRCSCGEYLYGDFKDSNPQRLNELIATLNEQGAGDASNPTNSQASEVPQSQPRPLQPAYLSPLNVTRPPSYSPSLKPQSSITAATEIYSRRSSNPVYFEVCVNSGRWQRRLGEVNVSEAHNDSLFFEAVKKTYLDMRRRRKFSFFEPRDIRYVRFSVENRSEVGILSRPDEISLPPEREVRRKQYEYRPCPLEDEPPVPANVLLHFLSSRLAPRHIHDTWTQRLPKKIRKSIFSTNSPVVFGWGIHIIEGPKIWIMKCVLCIGLLGAFTATGLWWGLKRDVQGGTGVGSLILGAMALVVASLLTFVQDS